MDNGQDLTTFRRNRVKALASEGFPPTRIAELIAGEGLLNQETGKPYSLSTIQRDMATPHQNTALVNVAEMIGRNEREKFYRLYTTQHTVDPHRTDYMWWDMFRNCIQPGFELAGLFAKPVAEIPAYYVWGNEPLFTLLIDELDEENDVLVDERMRLHTNREIKRWVNQYKTQLLNMLVENYSLGDQFVFMNLDGSISIPSPDTVRVVRNLVNPEEIVEAIVTTKYEGVTVEDHFTATQRVRMIRLPGAKEVVIEEMDNILGVIPLVVFSNDKRGNELYGRPIYEALVKSLAFQHYTELLVKALEGYRVMGNPIPTFSKVENVAATIEANKPPTPSTYDDGSGVTVTRDEIAFDANGAIVTSGDFDLKTPPVGFSDDMRKVLKAIFLLICDHTRIPEYMFGGAVEASKASVETQTPPFVSYVNGKRMQLDGTPGRMDGMLDLIWMMLMVKRLTDPRIHVGAVQSLYQDVTKEEDNVRFQKIIYAMGNSLVPPVEALTALHISQDPQRSVEEAEKETKRRMTELAEPQDDFESSLNAAAHKETDPEVTRPEGGDEAA